MLAQMGGYGRVRTVTQSEKELFVGLKENVEAITGVKYSKFEPIEC